MPSDGAFEIAHAESFPFDLGDAPKKVRNAYKRVVLPVLRQSPDQSNPPQIIKLKDWKQRWRMKVSRDYRLVYSVRLAERCVVLEVLDHRSKIYERIGADSDNEDHPPTTRIIANADYLLEKKPTPEEIGKATIIEANAEDDKIESGPDKELAKPISRQKLSAWGIPEEYHNDLIRVKTEGELLDLDRTMPEPVLLHVINRIFLTSIEAISQQPTRIAANPTELVTENNELISLESFLLNLDDKQREFVQRFSTSRPSGPWLLRGGPGSGKSTIALYCIQAMVQAANAELQLEDRPLQILFTTFTNSLLDASCHLLETLGIEEGNHSIKMKPLHKLASPFVTSPLDIPDRKKFKEHLKNAIEVCRCNNTNFNEKIADVEFLDNEFEWVIAGQGISSINDYWKDAERGGRGNRLNQLQKQHVWEIYETFQQEMHSDGYWTFPERMQEAASNVQPRYDYVFIDEAQDLSPIAIRFCIGLCRKPGGVFITADTNQSIYGNGLSWKQVASDLNFRGRTTVLRRNYRTTKELWEALGCLAQQEGDRVDHEALQVEPVYRGQPPILAWYSNIKKVGERLNTFLHEALIQERVGPRSAAILCPSGDDMDAIEHHIDARFNPKVMRSKDFDLKHPGVKITTMHAAKGLQFPVVAVFGLKEGHFPKRREGIDQDEDMARDKRLLFVACSRSMRRLIVFADREEPSSLITGISHDYWEIEEL